jgi:2-keto-4-pentenoate hydratase/2-oxohepta-3-ene-1,7-dioic acid hydratase in catechol pathway
MTRWVRYAAEGGARFGMIEGDTIRTVEGSPFGDWHFAGGARAIADVKLLTPVQPLVLYAAGMNYEDHARIIATRDNKPLTLPTEPEMGYRSVAALIAHGEDIIIPWDATEKMHYEGELVAVIGKTARHVTPETALEHVFGYTIGNDVSERSWQFRDKLPWRAKNSDTFKPMGPWIETDIDLASMCTTVRVNGEVTTHFRTADMIFTVAEAIAHLSRNMTLHPGDVVWMGTGGFSKDLKDGDVVEITLDGIGTLRNPLRREARPAHVLARAVIEENAGG